MVPKFNWSSPDILQMFSGHKHGYLYQDGHEPLNVIKFILARGNFWDSPNLDEV